MVLRSSCHLVSRALQEQATVLTAAGNCTTLLALRVLSWLKAQRPLSSCTACEQARVHTDGCLFQAHDLVPIVEPEILIDGDHDIHRSADVSARVISACIAQLWQHNVDLEATLLKPQARAGKQHSALGMPACPNRRTPRPSASACTSGQPCTCFMPCSCHNHVPQQAGVRQPGTAASWNLCRHRCTRMHPCRW